MLPSGFSPFVEFSDETQQWRWIGKIDQWLIFLTVGVWGSHVLSLGDEFPPFPGPTQDTEKDLSALCQLWLDSKDLVVKVTHLLQVY